MEPRITLSRDDRTQLEGLLESRGTSYRTKVRIRIVLSAGAGQSNDEISATYGVDISHVELVRENYAAGGIYSLIPRRRDKTRSLTREQQAHLIALAEGPPPAGRDRWTYQLLADKLIELGYVDKIAGETVRRLVSEQPTSDVQRDESGRV